MLKVDFIVGIEAKPLGYSPWQLFKAKKKFDLKGGGGGNQPLFRKGACAPPPPPTHGWTHELGIVNFDQ